MHIKLKLRKAGKNYEPTYIYIVSFFMNQILIQFNKNNKHIIYLIIIEFRITYIISKS